MVTETKKAMWLTWREDPTSEKIESDMFGNPVLQGKGGREEHKGGKEERVTKNHILWIVILCCCCYFEGY